MTSHPQKIAVMGAGITGLCQAQVLAQSGHIIDLYDPQGFPAHNASFVAGGMLSPYGEIEHMPAPWIAAGLAGISFWRTLTHDNPADYEFSENGSLFIAHEDDHYILQRFQAHLPTECFEHILPQTLEPALPRKFGTGVYLRDEAHIHPAKTMALIIQHLQNHPHVTFHTTSVTPHDLSSSNYNHIIDCRGMGARDDEPDLRGVKGELLIVRNPEFSLSRPVRLMHPRYALYIVPRTDHVFMIGATNIESEDNNAVSIRSAMELLSALYTLHPSFGDAHIMEVTAGIRPSYPDNLPRIHQQDHVIRCNGLFRHGYLLAPILALCVDAMIDERPYEFISLLTGENT